METSRDSAMAGVTLVPCSLPRETFRKLLSPASHTPRDFFLFSALTNGLGVSNLLLNQWKLMPDQPSPDKVSLSVRVPRTLAQRLKRLAAQRGESLSELLTTIFTKATNHVELTPDDYRQIADETERASRMLRAKGSARKALDARFKKSSQHE